MTIFNVQGNEAPVIATWYQDVITMKDIPILFADGTEKVPLDCIIFYFYLLTIY